MLLIKYLLTAVLFVSPATAAIDAKQIASNKKAISRELSRAKGTIEKYDGGLISNLMVAKAFMAPKPHLELPGKISLGLMING